MLSVLGLNSRPEIRGRPPFRASLHRQTSGIIEAPGNVALQWERGNVDKDQARERRLGRGSGRDGKGSLAGQGRGGAGCVEREALHCRAEQSRAFIIESQECSARMPG